MIDQLNKRVKHIGPRTVFLLERYQGCPAARVYEGEPGTSYTDYATSQELASYLWTLCVDWSVIDECTAALRELGW
ncbi:MAG: hypothetical protein KKA73_18355 [Chloroflexi bacterium]|nr:hypothetical protein [Chloroflexota bacterium]MBU1749650.1 hypothetical protein [Chloroflexota bacterium]